MDLFLQMGYGMQSLCTEIITKWKSGTVILSPVNIGPNKIMPFSKQIRDAGGSVLFDPQMFYPKEGHVKLKEYDYWPLDGVSISDSASCQSICRELLRINTSIASPAIILPSIEMDESKFEYALTRMQTYIDFFASKTKKPLYATLCLYSETIRNSQAIEALVEYLRPLSVSGFYIIPHPSNSEYIVSDPLWAIGMMKLVACLKLSSKAVIIGYSNHQSLIYALAGADAIASGTYMNTRSFQPSKFKSPRDDDIKQKSTWYYLPNAFSEYKAALLDVAMNRGFLSLFVPQGAFANEYSAMLFGGAQPSSTNYRERNSFLHYLHCLKIQCEMLTKDTYFDTYSTYELMLNSSANLISELKKRGMSGQNRDFAPAIEANRVAMCATDEDYGLKLRFDWQEITNANNKT